MPVWVMVFVEDPRSPDLLSSGARFVVPAGPPRAFSQESPRTGGGGLVVPSPPAETSSFMPSFRRADSGPAGPGSRALDPPLQAAPARTKGPPGTCEAVALGGWGGCPQSPGRSPFPKLPEQSNLCLPEAFPEWVSPASSGSASLGAVLSPGASPDLLPFGRADLGPHIPGR